MLARHFSTFCVLLVAALQSSAAQAPARADTTGVARGTVSGGWSATNGTVTYMGTWTAIPDTVRATVVGTWTLADAQGETVAYGGWSAAKEPDRWAGVWRANIAGRDGEYSGAWTSTADLKGSARFADLFEKAAQTIVRGTWSSAGHSGAWAIRASK